MYKGYETAELWRLYQKIRVNAPLSFVLTEIIKELAKREMA